MIKIVLADDHAIVRSGFSMILNFQSDMEVVGTAADGIEAYTMVAKYRPDILIMDLSMPPGESGLIATGKIKEDHPDTKILILTMHDDEEYLFHILKNGASGYVLKNAPDEELLLAIRTIHGGGTYIHPKMATSLVREFIKKIRRHNQKILMRSCPSGNWRFCLWSQKVTVTRKLRKSCSFLSRRLKRTKRKSWRS